MVDINRWTADFLEKLRAAFGGRLRFAGLQGSYRRGEATEASDIDMVVVLDGLTPADLARYRALVREMPGADKACGFLCGTKELRAWPAHDRLQLWYDTRPLFGELDELVLPPAGEEVRLALRVEAANLYHAACHSFVFGSADDLSALEKGAFFLLRTKCLAESGRYATDRRELFSLAGDGDRAVLEARGAADERYARLIGWCAEILGDLGSAPKEIT